MKKTVTEEIEVCDVCQTTKAWPHQACSECGKQRCNACADLTPRFEAGVFHSNGNTLYLCQECYTKMLEQPNPRFVAFQRIQQLRAENRTYSDSFTKRSKEAEALVESFRKPQ